MKIFRIVIIAFCISGIGLTGCDKKEQADPQPDSPQPSTAGFRMVYGSLSKTSWPAEEDPIGNSFTGFSSPATDKPMWVGANYDYPGVVGISWMTVTRLDTAGKVLVTKKMYDVIRVVRATADGGCTVAGADKIVHLSSDGDVQWAKQVTYYANQNYYPINVYTLTNSAADGSSIFVGDAGLPLGSEMLVGKIDVAGQVGWIRSYAYAIRPGNAYDQGQIASVVTLPNGKIVLTGHRLTTPKTFLMRLSATGEVEWSTDVEVPEYRLWQTQLRAQADGTVVLVGAQAGNQNETALLQFRADGTLLRSQAIYGLKISAAGVQISDQGAIVMVGHNADNAINPTRPQGLFMGEINAQWRPEKVVSLEPDPNGRWFSGFGMALSAEGNYRYTLGNLIAPINGGVPSSFRLLKSKVAGARVCSSQAEQASLSVKPINPDVQSNMRLSTSSNLFQQQSFTPRLYPYNVEGKQECQ